MDAGDIRVRWSVVIPVYNEAAYLPRTLASLIVQTAPFRLILVDNGSTDDAIATARAQLAAAGIDGMMLEEARPGQVHALMRGFAAVESELVAICDADTVYPPHYLARAESLLDTPGTVAACAWLAPETGGRIRRGLRATHRLTVARLLPRQNHTSGAAHSFRTAALRAAGGYDALRWPYVLKDHELMNRVLAHGRQRYDRALWCVSSERRADRRAVRWTLAERIAYHLTPYAAQGWFFHRVLALRFAARGQADTVLRAQNWAAAR